MVGKGWHGQITGVDIYKICFYMHPTINFRTLNTVLNSYLCFQPLCKTLIYFQVHCTNKKASTLWGYKYCGHTLLSLLQYYSIVILIYDLWSSRNTVLFFWSSIPLDLPTLLVDCDLLGQAEGKSIDYRKQWAPGSMTWSWNKIHFL